MYLYNLIYINLYKLYIYINLYKLYIYISQARHYFLDAMVFCSQGRVDRRCISEADSEAVMTYLPPLTSIWQADRHIIGPHWTLMKWPSVTEEILLLLFRLQVLSRKRWESTLEDVGSRETRFWFFSQRILSPLTTRFNRCLPLCPVEMISHYSSIFVTSGSG